MARRAKDPQGLDLVAPEILERVLPYSARGSVTCQVREAQ